MKKGIAAAIIVWILMTMVTVPVNADEAETSGSCGKDATWEITGTGSELTLLISGTGKMTDYTYEPAPWMTFKDDIKTVIIEDGITYICRSAFSGCYNLINVTIPPSVTEFGAYAFETCLSLDNIVLPDGLTSISSNCFGGCTSLTEINIPDSVTSISFRAFAECSALTHLEIPDSVRSLGDGSFQSCTNLKSIKMPSGLWYLSNNLFANCTSLANVIIPDSVTRISDSTFVNCPSLTSIEIPNSVTAIGRYAFSQCTGLTSIKIPDSVVSIEVYAFDGCTNLTSVKLPAGITRIEDYMFRNCSNLAGIEIPISVTRLGAAAFYGCSSMNSVEISPRVTVIGGSLFAECSSLENVKLPSFIEEMGEQVFRNCTSLTAIKFPEGIDQIPYNTFEGCTGLTSVELPDGITVIRNSAFYNCSSLVSIKIPYTVNSIESFAFAKCSNLAVIELPQDGTKIGYQVFWDCSSLNSIEIPEGMETIGDDAFRNTPFDNPDVNCSVFYYGTEEEWNAIAPIHMDVDNEYSNRVYLTKSIIRAEQITPVESDIQLTTGQEKLIEIMYDPRNVTHPYCNFISSDTSVVKVDKNGILQAQAKAGTATITIRSSDGSNLVTACNVTVKGTEKIKGLTIKETNAEVAAGQSITLTPVFIPSGTPETGLTWTSSDKKIAQAGIDGLVIGKSMGKVTITATSVANPKISATCMVRVLFSDVTNKNLAAYEAIYWGADKGYVNGYGSYFDINGKCTRAQFVLFLWRTAGKPTPKTTTLKFKDSAEIEKLAPDYKKAVLWGSENGIVAGYTSGANAGKFCPNDPCTRGQVVTFLWRYKGQKPAKSGAKKFPDVPANHKYYRAIMWASSYGLTTGFSDGKFKPEETCTRGQCVTFLYRLLK